MLINLLLLFRHYQRLPEQPSEVYRNTIRLVLEKWDINRSVIRKSRYADFDAEKKLEFLSSLSYELTFSKQQKVFSLNDLIEVYSKIHLSYGLPKEESELVAREIESHSGLILKSGYDSFEFCHLSLQEYLCANYVVRSPMSKQILSYLKKYPAPIAVAITISADPSIWMASLLMQSRTHIFIEKNRLNSLIHRLILERPTFKPCEQLGFVGLLILSKILAEWKKHPFIQFFELINIKKSVYDALKFYDLKFENSDITTIRIYKKLSIIDFATEYGFPPLQEAEIPSDYINKILMEYGVEPGPPM